MAWRQPGNKPLSEPRMESLLTHICVARPQCFNVYINLYIYMCVCVCCQTLHNHWICIIIYLYRSHETRELGLVLTKIQHFTDGRCAILFFKGTGTAPCIDMYMEVISLLEKKNAQIRSCRMVLCNSESTYIEQINFRTDYHIIYFPNWIWWAWNVMEIWTAHQKKPLAFSLKSWNSIASRCKCWLEWQLDHFWPGVIYIQDRFINIKKWCLCISYQGG